MTAKRLFVIFVFCISENFSTLSKGVRYQLDDEAELCLKLLSLSLGAMLTVRAGWVVLNGLKDIRHY